jgi:hypothetical protein
MSIDFRKNANVLTAIQSSARAKARTEGDPYVVDGYELHAHPDLVDRLRSLMVYTPAATLEFTFGIPVLCTTAGRIFATAGGTNSLSLYLPEEEIWGRKSAEYGKPWRRGDAWTTGRPHTGKDEQSLIALLCLAFAAAGKAEADS